MPLIGNMFARLLHASRQQPVVPWAIRRDRLRRLQQLLLTHQQVLSEAIDQDFGHRSQHETAFLEVFTSLESIKHALRHAKEWMTPRKQATALWFTPGDNILHPQPLGVVGIIVPWNYPLLLAIGPLVGALAAGNTVMLKLSELTPTFGKCFADLLHQTFTEDEVRVVLGNKDVARAFSALPFDHLLFTGSTAVGVEVMRAASENLTPVTLELGGKSPAIIGPNANMDHAVRRIIYGKLLNAGQTCIAPDYVLLPEGQQEAFIAAARKCVAQTYPDLHTRGTHNSDYSSIINEPHFDRLIGLLDDAQREGAQLHSLVDVAPNKHHRMIPPTIVTQLPDTCRLMHEEIFGPILPLIGYDTLDTAIAYVNERPRPLALYVFERKQRHIDLVVEKTVSGGVTINDTLLHIAQENMPFGGVGASGMGAYHGEYGFKTFSHLKPVFTQHRFNMMGLFTPPYKKTFEKLLKILIK